MEFWKANGNYISTFKRQILILLRLFPWVSFTHTPGDCTGKLHWNEDLAFLLTNPQRSCSKSFIPITLKWGFKKKGKRYLPKVVRARFIERFMSWARKIYFSTCLLFLWYKSTAAYFDMQEHVQHNLLIVLFVLLCFWILLGGSDHIEAPTCKTCTPNLSLWRKMEMY